MSVQLAARTRPPAGSNARKETAGRPMRSIVSASVLPDTCGLCVRLPARQFKPDAVAKPRKKAFVKFYRWANLTPDSRAELAQTRINAEKIQNRTEFSQKHPGLSKRMLRNGELDRLKFPKGYFLPKGISDGDLVNFAVNYMKTEKITTKYKLELVHKNLYERLRTRGLLDRIHFEPGRDATDLKSMSAMEKVAYAKQVIKDNTITKRGQLKKLEPGLWTWIGDNGRWEDVGLPEGRRVYKWASLTPKKRLEEARRLIKEEGIATKAAFWDAHDSLATWLIEDGTFKRLGFGKHLGRWERMGKKELLDAILSHMREGGMLTLKELSRKAGGMYDAAGRKGIQEKLKKAVKKMRDEDRARRKAGKEYVLKRTAGTCTAVENAALQRAVA